MNDKEIAELFNKLLIAAVRKSKDVAMFTAETAIQNNEKIVCGFSTDMDMNKADACLKEWFDETENAIKDILAEQTSKLSHLLIENGYSDEVTAIETHVAPNSEIIARRQREAKKK